MWSGRQYQTIYPRGFAEFGWRTEGDGMPAAQTGWRQKEQHDYYSWLGNDKRKAAILCRICKGYAAGGSGHFDSDYCRKNLYCG